MPIRFFRKKIKVNINGETVDKYIASLERGEVITIDKVAEIADLAIVNDIIKKSGAWFSYDDERRQGRENLVNMLKANEKIYNEIFSLVSKTVLKNDAPIIGSFQDIINSSTIKEITESNENKRRSKKLKDSNENLIVEEVNEIK